MLLIEIIIKIKKKYSIFERVIKTYLKTYNQIKSLYKVTSDELYASWQILLKFSGKNLH